MIRKLERDERATEAEEAEVSERRTQKSPSGHGMNALALRLLASLLAEWQVAGGKPVVPAVRLAPSSCGGDEERCVMRHMHDRNVPQLHLFHSRAWERSVV
jgi:hypothetical protein